MSEMTDRLKRVIAAGGDAQAVLRELRVPSPETLAAAATLPRSTTAQEIWEATVDAA
ncbi:hypothetical protein JJB99_19300 [Bradyrhizobium diazoefficiens]|uniref:hypothetical protein n=1 Tax=Bradyrhizobium diazoefficiens TaxID=1355477 RepID=UPI00190C67D9|nr:hypothetical protein [Bradyrhizobium diazoefficiens]QQO11664.1 hypothetical protein JJB99_19300 [Bradyrhizobium diazoefficiens]